MFRVTAVFVLCVTGVFSQAMAEPVIEKVEGAVKDGDRLLIEGVNFTEKEDDRPLLWWKADEGKEPSSLGRQDSWPRSRGGEVSKHEVASGSSQAFRFDHGSSAGSAIGELKFNSDRVYFHRKVMEDFDIRKNVSLRSRVIDVDGSFEVGQTVEGRDSGATGVIQSIDERRVNTEIFYEQEGGTINDEEPVDFIYGEEMRSDTAVADNNEGSESYPTGLLRTFNFKTLRFWGEDGNNIWIGSQGRSSNRYRVTPEYTDSTRSSGDLEYPYQQEKGIWRSQEVVYQGSDVGVSNGMWKFIMDGTVVHDEPVATVSESRNTPYNRIAQSQVSNGAQPESWMYYDSIYVDESWHRVVLCAESNWESCTKTEVQIPQEWNDSSVEVVANVGIFADKNDIYLYVANKEGVANSEGYKLCLNCPEKTELSVE